MNNFDNVLWRLFLPCTVLGREAMIKLTQSGGYSYSNIKYVLNTGIMTTGRQKRERNKKYFISAQRMVLQNLTGTTLDIWIYGSRFEWK